MGFPQALQRLEVHQPMDNKIRQSFIDEQNDNHNSKWRVQQQKQRWSIFSSRRSLSWAAASSHSKTTPRNQTTITADNDDDDGGFIPAEFLCPISGCLMADPAIVSSGHTFDRACLQACYSLGFSPSFPDGSVPDFSAVIPNLALRSTILKWCKQHSLSPPKSLHYSTAENIVRAKMARQKQRKLESQNRAIGENYPMIVNSPEILVSSSSGESVSSTGSSVSSLPVQFVTRPRCYSSGSMSSSETDEFLINPEEEEELVAKLNSAQVPEVEEAVISLRKLTRTKDEHNSCCIQLCSPQLLSALRSLIASRYTNIQVNSVACVVNLSLHKQNKVKIVRSGILPPLIEVLKGGFAEAQEHAAGAIFSLALDEQNRTAIGVLGALPPLLNLLRSGSERTRDDSSSALYHLSLIQSNRSKMVRIGSVGALLGGLKSGHMPGRVLSILGNLAFCNDGRAAMLDGGGVECLVRRLRIEMESESSLEESCVSVLCWLSQGGLRFKGLAKAAGAEEVVAAAAERCRAEETREKAKMILEMIQRKAEEDVAEEVDWEEVLEVETRSEFSCKTRCTVVGDRRDEATYTCNSF